MANLARRLEVAANLAIVVMAGVAVGTWAWYLRRPDPPAGGGTPAPQYAVGEVVGPVPELRGAAGRPTLLLVMASTCHFCTDSMGFYRQLVEHKRDRWPALDVVAASREQPLVLGAYLREHGLKTDRAVHIPHDSAFKVTLTPTLILLDAAGRVLQIWVGRLSKDAELEAISAVDAYREVRRPATIPAR